MATATSSLGVKKELARFLLQQVKEQRLDKSTAAGFLKELAEPTSAGADAVAIIGLACRFPLADSKEAFWDNLRAGHHAMRAFPPHRRADLAGIDAGRSELFSGGFLERVDEFDNDYFRIPPNVARHMDPYQRLFMETLVETIEDAGYHRGAFHGKPVGVFAGNDHTHRLFNSYLDFVEQPDFNSVTGSWTGVLASRLSYLFNLKGPAVVVDTSCSSGLVALDYAIKALRAGDCEAALVGAANVFFAPGKGIVGEIENADAQVRAFDRGASGTVWGEGVAAILVKPLAHALRDGDHIYAVVKGIAVNNDGASNGLTAPNAKAQQEVILKAWERARIDPEDLSYIETHGTGTHLGDPIEIKGLMGAFSRHSARKQFCGIGSVKTNIGHTVGVAGLASLIKVLLSLERNLLPPSLHFDQPNPFIDFCNSPVYVNDRATPWRPGDKPRLAGVSSFSLSGTNCHVVLQDAPRHEADASQTGSARIFPISARNQDLLAVTLRRYLDWCGVEGFELADACYTAAVGREHHAVRAALVVESAAELRAGLATLLEAVEAGADAPPHGRIFYSGTGEAAATGGATLDRDAKQALAETLQRQAARASTGQRTQSLGRLASLYTAGAAVKWQELYQGEARRRMPLPPQPFQRKRFWDKAPGETRRVRGARPGRRADATARCGRAARDRPARSTARRRHRRHGRSAAVPGRGVCMERGARVSEARVERRLLRARRRLHHRPQDRPSAQRRVRTGAERERSAERAHAGGVRAQAQPRARLRRASGCGRHRQRAAGSAVPHRGPAAGAGVCAVARPAAHVPARPPEPGLHPVQRQRRGADGRDAGPARDRGDHRAHHPAPRDPAQRLRAAQRRAGPGPARSGAVRDRVLRAGGGRYTGGDRSGAAARRARVHSPVRHRPAAAAAGGVRAGARRPVLHDDRHASHRHRWRIHGRAHQR